MYNPASILHTLQRLTAAATQSAGTATPAPTIAFLTLGTNHVYRLKSTGEIVDNCQKRPAALFREEQLSVAQCVDYLRQSVAVLRTLNPHVRVIVTVSPIRYRKYGYHASQLSKSVLLLAADALGGEGSATYFPSYELLMDELRDYRFYAPDMLHPSTQAVDYIWERLVDSYFSPAAKDYLAEWHPIKQALAHKPFNPDSPEYRAFREQTYNKLKDFRKKYPHLAI